MITIGTVSHGTMRNEHLIPAFIEELNRINPEIAQALLNRFGIGSGPTTGTDEFYESEEAGELVDQLFDTLDGFAPEGMYFGALEGDGSDYGFWNYEDTF